MPTGKISTAGADRLLNSPDRISVDAGTPEANTLMQSWGSIIAEYRKRSRQKWETLGWLSEKGAQGFSAEDRGYPPLRTEAARDAMAMILENQNQFQLHKAGKVVGGFLLQDTATADEALPTKYALPIVRRVYALMLDRDFGVVQPLPGPTGYVFWLDFVRENDPQAAGPTNILSIEYNAFVTPELGIPQKGKLVLSRATLTVQKQLMGSTWSLEALEDARAQLGLDIEQELMTEWSNEFVRNLFGRHLQDINYQAINGTFAGIATTNASDASMVAPWAGANTSHVIPAWSSYSSLTGSHTEFKSVVYNTLIDADVDHQRANRYPSDGIIAGYGLAGLLQKLDTATQAQSPTNQNLNALGITDYGTFAGRWRVWGTDFMPNAQGFLYKRNPTQLQAGHIYAPYVPIQVMPAIYGDYNTSTGSYTNSDAYTRNIRERSADIVTKPYAFQPVSATSLTFD